MFFDEPKEDGMFLSFLIEVAKKQREILQYSFDWKERASKKGQWETNKSLFGKKTRDVNDEKLLKELDGIRDRAECYHQRQGYPGGIFWWKVPWEQIEKYLQNDLDEQKGNGNWCYEYH